MMIRSPISTLFLSSFLLAAMLVPLAGSEDFVHLPVTYEQDGIAFEGTLVYDKNAASEAAYKGETLLGLLMVPNWMGPGDAANKKAEGIAGSDRIVFVADVYGVDVRPENSSEAGEAAGELRSGDRQRLRDRMAHSLTTFKDAARKHNLPMDPSEVLAIGFCFGGGAVLELARSGADVPGVVSFHGNLDTPRPADPGGIRSKILVLHGAVDPYVPMKQVEAFQEEMRESGPDWQLVAYGGTVHSFTNPQANSEGSKFNPVASQRAFAMLDAFAQELFGIE